MIEAGSVHLQRELNKQIETAYGLLASRLDRGQIETLAEYKFIAGQLVGYTRVLDMIKDVMKSDDEKSVRGPT